MTALLEIEKLTVQFGSATLTDRILRRRARVLRAVDDLSLTLEQGEALAVVGESGCGKSTLARAIVGLVPIASGRVHFDGMDIAGGRDRSTRRRIQMVFQDPGSSLNPSLTVRNTLAEVLKVHSMVPADRIGERCAELMDLVELPPAILDARPQRLSGGQKQRIGIARALAAEPDLLIADEAVAALDVSVQASVLNLLRQLRHRLGLTLLFISHDLAVVRNLCDRVAVMYLGTVVEESNTEEVFGNPRHPYTRALLSAVPRIGVKKTSGEAALAGEPPSPLALPLGCRFHPRCPIAAEVCRIEEPLLESRQQHAARCHFAWESTEPITIGEQP